MEISLKYLISTMFKPKKDSYFYRFIGIKNKDEYNNELKVIQLKCNEIKDKVIIFDNEIPLNGEMELIQYIYNELLTMDIYNMANQDIVIFDEYNINNRFLNALQYSINLAIQNEKFFNDNIRNNFITKLIVWTYTLVKEMSISEEINPKVVYYGEIERHEIYFLILLYNMGFDVIYLNPLKEEYFDEIDADKLSILIKEIQIDTVDSFEERCSKGKLSENIETITKQIQSEIHQELFVDTGMFKPWQFRGGFTKSALLDTILEDIYIYYNEPAKLREGFKVEGKVVKVPCFFKKIDGEHLDQFEYQKMVRYCIESSNTLFFNHGNISRDVDVSGDMFKLMFCQLSDGTFDIEEIKKLDIYRFKKYSNEIQNFLLNKFNEVIKRKDLYEENLDKEASLKLLVLVLALNEEIVRLIDNFDFVDRVPKIVIYLNSEDGIIDNMKLLLGYIHNIGIDIIIFNPSGLCNISNIIKNERFNNTRLQNINYNSNYKNLTKVNTKQSVFTKLFR
ncbi:YceG family protein [Romboutsia sp.]|uniref:YceG family protein n=1 Tax=Romboutsia sp. TaxID=1965302 RepID=UPI003F3A5C4C